MQHLTDQNIPHQIRAALKQRKARVIDLFRQLDDDESGLISAAEFVKAMHELGMKHAPPEALTAIFSSFDPDNSGSIDDKEDSGEVRGTSPSASLAASNF